MTKPITKKASSRRRKPAHKAKPKAAPKPVAVVEEPAPSPTEEVAPLQSAEGPATVVSETEVEELREEISKFDHDGDGHPGGSLPHNAEATDDAEPTADAEAEVTEGDEPTEPEAPAEEEAPDQDARSQTVSLGSVECRMRRIPVGKVLGLLDPDGLRRIEAEKSTASFEPLCKRLRDTDGRATPIIFEASREGAPTILHGFAELAAAEVCGIPEVFVILVPPGGASEAQPHIVEMLRHSKDKTSDDDELFYRVHAEG